jgi:bile acid:Na+ symporter, BASS family
MTQPLDLAYVLALAVTLWATAVGSGLSHRPGEVTAAMVDRRRFVSIVVLDAVVIPLLVYALVRILAVPEGYAAGLILVGAASAGAIGLAVVRLADGDVPLAIGLIVVLELGNLVTIPFWSTILLSGHVRPPLGEVAATLALGVVLPLIVGAGLRRMRPQAALGWARPMRRVSTLSLVILIVIAVGRDIGDVVGAAAAVSLVALVTVTAALLAGWALGSPGGASRSTAALVTASRASTPALAVASSTYGLSSDAASAVVVFALISLLVSGPVAVLLARAQWRAAAHASNARAAI